MCDTERPKHPTHQITRGNKKSSKIYQASRQLTKLRAPSNSNHNGTYLQRRVSHSKLQRKVYHSKLPSRKPKRVKRINASQPLPKAPPRRFLYPRIEPRWPNSTPLVSLVNARWSSSSKLHRVYKCLLQAPWSRRSVSTNHRTWSPKS